MFLSNVSAAVDNEDQLNKATTVIICDDNFTIFIFVPTITQTIYIIYVALIMYNCYNPIWTLCVLLKAT